MSFLDLICKYERVGIFFRIWRMYDTYYVWYVYV